MKKALTLLMILMLTMPAAVCAEGSAGLTLRYTAVPEQAFSAENDRVIAAAPDGTTVLIANTYALYLWHVGTGTRIPVSFPDPAAQEALSELVVDGVLGMGPGRNLSAAQRAERRDQLAETRDSWLAERGLTRFASLDQAAACFPHMLELGASCLSIDGSAALVVCDRLRLGFVLDLGTGEAGIIPGDSQPLAMHEGRVLYRDGILDPAAGEKSFPDLMPAPEDGRPELYPLPAAALFPDDARLILLLAESAFSPDGNDYWCVDVTAGSNRAYKIGNYTFSMAPDRILAAGNARWLMLYKASTALHASCAILDTETGTVTEAEAGTLLPLAAAEHGFLCWDLRTYDVVLLNPADNSRSRVSLAPGYDWSGLDFTAAAAITAGDEGMLFIQRKPMHGYFVFEEN